MPNTKRARVIITMIAYDVEEDGTSISDNNVKLLAEMLPHHFKSSANPTCSSV